MMLVIAEECFAGRGGIGTGTLVSASGGKANRGGCDPISSRKGASVELVASDKIPSKRCLAREDQPRISVRARKKNAPLNKVQQRIGWGIKIGSSLARGLWPRHDFSHRFSTRQRATILYAKFEAPGGRSSSSGKPPIMGGNGEGPKSNHPSGLASWEVSFEGPSFS